MCSRHSGEFPFITESFAQSFTEANTDVFHRVVGINVQIAFRKDFQIEGSMLRQMGEHMIQKPDAGLNFGGTGAIEIQFELNLRFRRGSVDSGSA